MNQNDQQLIKKLSSEEDERLARFGQLLRQHRQALKVRKGMEGEYRKAGIARAESQEIMDRIQKEVGPVEAVIISSHEEMCSLGEDVAIPVSTIPEEKSSG